MVLVLTQTPLVTSSVYWAIDHYPLDVIIQPIPYPVKSPYIKSVFFPSITDSNLICTTEVKVRGECECAWWEQLVYLEKNRQTSEHRSSTFVRTAITRKDWLSPQYWLLVIKKIFHLLWQNLLCVLKLSQQQQPYYSQDQQMLRSSISVLCVSVTEMQSGCLREGTLCTERRGWGQDSSHTSMSSRSAA